MKAAPAPRVGRANYVQDQKRQVMADKRTKRTRTRSAQKRAALKGW